MTLAICLANSTQKLRRGSFFALVVDNTAHVITTSRAHHMGRHASTAFGANSKVFRFHAVMRATFSGS